MVTMKCPEGCPRSQLQVFPSQTHPSPSQRLHLLPSFSQSSQNHLLLHPPSENLKRRGRPIRDRQGEEKHIAVAFPAGTHPDTEGLLSHITTDLPGPAKLVPNLFLCPHPAGSQGSGSLSRLLSLRTRPRHRMVWISHLRGFLSPPTASPASLCLYSRLSKVDLKGILS